MPRNSQIKAFLLFLSITACSICSAISTVDIVALNNTPLETWNTSVTTGTNDSGTFVSSLTGPGVPVTGNLTSIGTNQPVNISFDYVTSGSSYSISINAPGAVQTLGSSGSFNLFLDAFETIDFTFNANGSMMMSPMPPFTPMIINGNAILTLTNFSVTSAVPEPLETSLAVGLISLMGVVFFRRYRHSF